MFAIVTHSHQETAEMSLMIDTQQLSYHTLYVSEQSDMAIASLSCQNCIVAHDKGSDPMTSTMVIVMGVTSYVSRVSEAPFLNITEHLVQEWYCIIRRIPSRCPIPCTTSTE